MDYKTELLRLIEIAMTESEGDMIEDADAWRTVETYASDHGYITIAAYAKHEAESIMEGIDE